MRRILVMACFFFSEPFPETIPNRLAEFVSPLRFYNSRTHGQRIVAKVEAITADGLYDLDVKKAALPSNISRYAMRLQFSWV